MRKILLILVCSMSSFMTTHATPVPTDPKDKKPETVAAEVQQMTSRLEEIRDMDRSQLSRAERKALRGEVREIKKRVAEVHSTGGGIYISAGAIILILLLIIIL
ncbi:MAG: hypothetical protein KDC99_17315 [Cyclobacteriaceae bacterium]|nr:hypothetical protein [Cyclobacteriaceae bacterium]